MNDLMVRAQTIAQTIISNVEKVIIGKHDAVELAVIALLSKGHLLIEDAPGVGKTMLVRSMAKSLDCTFKRIQFTPDMLPGDITGVSVYNQKIGDFEFRPGPIFAQFVLADEINRASPKVQSALLECMEEGQVTIDGVTNKMPTPFHVLATQNPVEYEGTFPLPETQLDRFIIKINLGYPSATEEVNIIDSQKYNHPIENIQPVANGNDLETIQQTVKEIYVDDNLKKYIVALVGSTRSHPDISLGVSPRGSLALFRTAQARALLHDRDYVLPDDIKALAVSVLSHRIIVHRHDTSLDKSDRKVISEILDTVPVPGTLVR